MLKTHNFCLRKADLDPFQTIGYNTQHARLHQITTNVTRELPMN